MSLWTILRSIAPHGVRQQVRHAIQFREKLLFRRYHPFVDIVKPSNVIQCAFGRYVRIDRHAWVYDTYLGDHSYVAEHGYVACATVGKFCSIASRTYVGLGQHPSRGYVSTHPVFYRHDPAAFQDWADHDYFPGFVRTTIGHDVWIGSAAQIRGGVTIGNGAIIGAGAVVTGNVEPYSIVVGVPARHQRYRFDPDTIAFLERFQWWNRDESWLRENFEKFHNVEAFRAEFESSVE